MTEFRFLAEPFKGLNLAFAVSAITLKEINTFIQQGCIILIKSDKYIYNVSKDLFFYSWN